MKKLIIMSLVCLIVIAFAYIIKERVPLVKTLSAQVSGDFVRRNSGGIYLSDLDLKPTVGAYIKDDSPEGDGICLALTPEVGGLKRTYEKGICTTSNFRMSYRLDRSYKEFIATVGHHWSFPEYEGTLIFRVFVDGKEVYRSKDLRHGDTEDIKVSLKGADNLTLSVEDDGLTSSYVLWADASFIPLL